MHTISVRTNKRNELIDVTDKVRELIEKAGMKNGVAVVVVPHTTAGITVNENADPSVKKDIENTLNKLVPEGAGYSHAEGNPDSHIKSSLVGHSVMLIIENGEVQSGAWQGIMFCEFDGPRNREIWLELLEKP